MSLRNILPGDGRSDLLVISALAVLYTVFAKISLWFSIAGGNVTLIFPPSGIALAFLLIFGRKVWPGVLVGAVAANLWVGDAIALASIIAIGSTLQAVAGHVLLTKKGFKDSLERLEDYFKLILWGGAVSCIVAASVGAMILTLWNIADWNNLVNLFIKWWMGDFLGIMLVTPAILVWRTRPMWLVNPPNVLEAVVILGVALIYGQVTFLNAYTEIFGSYGRQLKMHLSQLMERRRSRSTSQLALRLSHLLRITWMSYCILPTRHCMKPNVLVATGFALRVGSQPLRRR